jgi:sigma-E factor negative regulatory protein RseA
MSKETREHLSALVDGEINRETSRFLVRRLGADEELRATWTRYHLIRDCLRHQDGSIAGDDLCSRVSRALENEQPVKAARLHPASWLKPVAGLAIAASVALMAVVAVGPGMPGASQATSEVASEVRSETFVSPSGFDLAPSSSEASFTGTNAKMNAYMLRHYQAAGTTAGKGFVTFVPIVITGSKARVKPENSEDAASPDESRDQETTTK